MKRFYITSILIIAALFSRAQYAGGTDDGFSKSSVSNLNPLPNIYRGGNDDGFSHASVSGLNPLPNIYRGGNDDGFSHASVTGLNPLSNIYRGGSDDGFSHAEVTNQNPQLFAITCPADITVSCIEEAPCPAGINAFLALPGVTATGFCSTNLTYTCNTILTSGDNCNGIFTRTHTVTDDCGNAASCSQIITVNDNTNPTASNPAAINVQCIANIPVANPNVVITEADNCSIPTVTLQSETNNGGTGCTGSPYIVTRTYRVTDACNNFIDVVQTLTALDNTNPVITGCKTFTSRPLDFGETNYTVQGNEFDVTATDNCSLSSLAYNLSGANSGSGTTLSSVNLLSGATIVTWTATDACGNTSTCVFTVTIDKRPTIIVYTGDNDEQYSDHTNLSAELRDGLTNAVLATKTISFVIGTQNKTAVTNGSGVASATLHIYQNVGDYDVTAAFAGDNTYAASTTTEDYDILKENAIVDYTGPEFISVYCPAATCSTTVLLSASVKDAVDGMPGDIRKARVKFYIVGGADISDWLTPGLVNPADTTVGVVSHSWVVPVPASASGGASYSIGVKVDCNTTPNPDEGNYVGNAYGTLAVSRSGLNEFITGGGHIKPTASNGQVPAGTGLKLNFGFNVKWNKSLKNLQGNVNIIYRTATNVYQIKATSMTSLSVNSAIPCSKKAIFNSKANLLDITNPNIIPQPVPGVPGGLTLQLILTDNGEPGINNDSIGVTLWNGNNLVFSSNWVSIQTLKLALNGGNIVVHNGVNCPNNNTKVNNEITAKNMEMETAPEIIPFTVKAWPNPTANNFTLQAMSNTNEAIEITVYDISGKLLKKMNGNAGQIFRFGNEWKAGSYVAVIRQGQKQKTIKLVKQ
jgi:hypothetical protein